MIWIVLGIVAFVILCLWGLVEFILFLAEHEKDGV